MDDTYELARNSAVLFDLGAEGRIRISGPECGAAVDELCSADFDLVTPYKGVVSLFTESNGELIAIATVFKGDDEVYVFTEAGTAQALYAHLSGALAGRGIAVEDLRPEYAWYALVGPEARDRVAMLAGEDVLGLPYLGFEDNERLQLKLFRMGHCGEYEYRFLAPAARREELRGRLTPEGTTVGDASRLATLMMEMRSLSRSDVPDSAGPIEAGLHWMISFRKEGLLAGDVFNARKRALELRALMVVFDEAGKIQAGDMLTIEGNDVGVIARVSFSPTLDRDVGLAYVRADLGWVGVPFLVNGRRGTALARGASAPLFVTKTVRAA